MRILVNGQPREVPDGTELYSIAVEEQKHYDAPIALAVVNGMLRELFHCLTSGDAQEGGIPEVSFITVNDKAGYDAFRRSLSMLFFAAVHEVTGGHAGNVTLHFACGSGFYFTIRGMNRIDADFIGRVKKSMLDMVEKKLLFTKQQVPIETVKKKFHDYGMPDKEKLFRIRLSSFVNIYSLAGYEDYYYGFMLSDTSLLGNFELIPYHEGVVVQMPERGNPDVIPPFITSEKLFAAQIEGEKWAETLGIGTVGELNDQIIAGNTSSMILISEALQEAKISELAEMIADRGNVRFVMIAGPSSSGKTTFSQRLAIQLSAHGLTPHYIGTDNYFINREDMVPGPDGKLDFESINAVDTEQFNADMNDLLAGKTVEIPTFDFITGRRVMSGEKMVLGPTDILVIEGLHSLNDALSSGLPEESKFRVYISALTQLNIDEHNRVPSGDGRLIRRIVRDHRTRGYSASATINQWGSVRKGETENVFPYQDKADAVFNSALPYDLAALKTYVQPLLFQVEKTDPAYFEARRLLKFLDYFIAIPVSGVPMNSILREFVGDGCFRL